MKLIELMIPTNTPLYYKSSLDTYLCEYANEFDINNSIYEGVIQSYPRQDLISRLKVVLNMRIYPDSSEYGTKDILIQFYPSDANKMPALLQLIQQHGWFISYIETNTGVVFRGNELDGFLKSNYDIAAVGIEARYGTEIETPKILYHTTPLSVWNLKIKHQGLSPKTKSISAFHPDRVYVATNSSAAIALAKELAKAKLQLTKTRHTSSKFNPLLYYKSWVLLKIDTSKIPQVRNLSYFKVHEDPSAEDFGGLYTVNYIPPGAIKLVKTFNAY